jgi:hypothetical protein
MIYRLPAESFELSQIFFVRASVRIPATLTHARLARHETMRGWRAAGAPAHWPAGRRLQAAAQCHTAVLPRKRGVPILRLAENLWQSANVLLEIPSRIIFASEGASRVRILLTPT